MIFRSWAVLGCLLTSICGCTNVDYKANLQQAGVCCNQLADIPYQTLEYDKPLTAEVGGSKSQARNFPEGKSFFTAVRLPEFAGPYEIQISSEPVSQQLFVPRALLLNANHQVVRQIPAGAFDYSNGSAYHKFFLNRDEGLRYMVLYTDTQKVGKESEMRDVQINTNTLVSGSYIFFYNTGSDIKQKIRTAEGGQVTIKALKYQPRDIN